MSHKPSELLEQTGKHLSELVKLIVDSEQISDADKKVWADLALRYEGLVEDLHSEPDSGTTNTESYCTKMTTMEAGAANVKPVL